MKRLICCLLIGSFFSASDVRVFGERSGIALAPRVSQNLDLLEVWIKARMAFQGLPGVSIGIVDDDDLIYAKGFGLANVEKKKPMTSSTLYRIASHSKLFTAISIMQLRDEGKLRLDDPVKDHLPEFSIAIKHPNARPVTIRGLLTHSSGIPREAASAYWQDFKFPTTAEVVERMKNQETILPSGDRFKYSNLAYGLMGMIIEKKSGLSFADYVEKNIMKPLGMDDSSVAFPDAHKAKLAVGYGRRMPDGSREVFPFVDAHALAAATGVTSSVTDMAKFVSWQLRLRENGGNEVLAAATLREMQRPQLIGDNWKHGRGLGFGVTYTEDRDLVGHGGLYPGYRTSTNVSVREGVGVIVFGNSLDVDVYPGSTWSISDRIFEWIIPAMKKARDGDKGESVKPDWKSLIGSYRMRYWDSHVMFLDGEMVLLNPNAPNPKQSITPLEHVSGNTFKLMNKFRSVNYGSEGEPVTFDFGPDGKVKHLKVVDIVSTPIEF